MCSGTFLPIFFREVKPCEWRLILQFYNCRHFPLPWDWILNFSSFDTLRTHNSEPLHITEQGGTGCLPSLQLISVFIYSFLVLSLIFIYRAGSYGGWFKQQGPLHHTITASISILAFEHWAGIYWIPGLWLSSIMMFEQQHSLFVFTRNGKLQ